MWHASTTEKRWAYISIPYSSSLQYFRSVLSVPLPTIHAGDMIVADAVVPITNPYTYVIMVGRFLCLTGPLQEGQTQETQQSSALGVKMGGGPVTRNIAPITRHDFFTQSATYRAPSEMTDRCVNYIIYSASQLIPNPSVVNQFATVDPGSYLDVKVIRASEIE